MPERPLPKPTVLHTITSTGLDHRVVGVRALIGPQAEPVVDLDGPIEQRERVRAALTSAVFAWPDGALTLDRDHPAGQLGSSADLAISIAVLTATRQVITWPELADTLILGELDTGGAIRPCRGVYPVVKAAKAAGLSRVIVPAENYAEARLVDGIAVAIAGDALAWVNSWLVGAFAVEGAEPIVEPDPLGPLLITADSHSGDVTVESVGTGPVPGSPPWDRVDGITLVSY